MLNKTKLIPTKGYLEKELKTIKENVSSSEYKYLKALLNLDISVLNSDYYDEDLEKFDVFKMLSLYNICKRSSKLINELDLHNKNLVNFLDFFSYYLKLEGDIDKIFFAYNNSFCTNFSNVKKIYNIYYRSRINGKQEEIEFLNSAIENINTGKKRNSDGSIMSYHERQKELINLNKKILYLSSVSDETIDDYNKINECLENDFGVENVFGNDKQLVRSLSFIDVYEKRF